MDRSVHLPVTNERFEIYDFSGIENQERTNEWLERHNDSAERFRNSESLFDLHTHDVMEVFFFLGGDCEFFCEGNTYTLRPGDVVVVPPYAVHKAEVKDLEQYERMILNVSPQLLNDFMLSDATLEHNWKKRKTERMYLSHHEDDTFRKLIHLMKTVTTHIKEGESSHTFTLHYLLFQALQLILPLSPFPRTENSEKDERLNRILAYIERNLKDPALSLDRVSHEFHLNKYYFSHYFKQAMNLPFYRYVQLKRLSNAIALMKENDYNLDQVAVRCGFSDYSSFYRVFRNVYQRSPKSLQKELKP